MKKHTVGALLAVFALTLSMGAQAKDKKVTIQSNSSGLPAALSESIAQTSVSMGVKEPVSIRSTTEGGNRYAVVSGSSSTTCKIKLSQGANPNIMGLSCK